MSRFRLILTLSLAAMMLPAPSLAANLSLAAPPNLAVDIAQNNAAAIKADDAPVYIKTDIRAFTPDETARLETGEIISEIWRDKTLDGNAVQAFAAVNVNASPAVIWAIMTSCEASVEIVKDMKSCRIIEANKKGQWDIREQRFAAPFPLGDFRSVFRTQYTPYQKMRLTRAGGDMKIQDAIWTLTSLGNGETRVIYKAAVALKIPVPRILLRRAVRKDTPKILANLRRAAERETTAPREFKTAR